jgi:hypothetical protein
MISARPWTVLRMVLRESAALDTGVVLGAGLCSCQAATPSRCCRPHRHRPADDRFVAGPRSSAPAPVSSSLRAARVGADDRVAES